MSPDDVEPYEMNPNDLPDPQVETAIAGVPQDAAFEQTADFLMALRSFGESVEEPVPTGALTEFVGTQLTTENGDLSAMAASNVYGPELIQVAGLPTSHEQKGNRKMLSGITAFMATLTGKVVLGSTVAFASVSGAHAADIIDVPLLPDTPEVVVIDDGDDFELAMVFFGFKY